MLKVINTKDESLLQVEIRKERNRLNLQRNFQEVSLSTATELAQDVSIFGDLETYLVRVNDSEMENMSEEVLKLLKNSHHLIVLVGEGSTFQKGLEKMGEKVLKLEKVVTFDFPADLVAALQKKDKKNSWVFLLRELKNKEAEVVHGTCVFAYKSLLTYMVGAGVNSPQSGVKDFTFKQAGVNAKLGKREKVEVVDTYFKLVLNYHKARNGEGDLASQLEMWVLES